jgi:hypothetical protein
MSAKNNTNDKIRDLAKILAELRAEGATNLSVNDADTAPEEMLGRALKTAGLADNADTRNALREHLFDALRDVIAAKAPKPAPTVPPEDARARLIRASMMMQHVLFEAAAIEIAKIARDPALNKQSLCGCDPIAVLTAWTMSGISSMFSYTDDMLLDGSGTCWNDPDVDPNDADCLHNE